SIEAIFTANGYINYIKNSDETNIKNEDLEKDKLLIVTGCLSQRYREELAKDIPEIDIIIGVDEYEKLPELILEGLTLAGSNSAVGIRPQIDSLQNTAEDGRERINTLKDKMQDDNERLTSQSEQTILMAGNASRYLKIAEGCDNCCTYCIIPKIRGAYRSVPMEQVLKQANKLVAEGAKEIILIAQDVTSYGLDFERIAEIENLDFSKQEKQSINKGKGNPNLSKLIRELAKIDQLQWIRLMYCYEDKITDELIELIKTEDKVCKYIDIPLQHINDRVLSDMNRNSTRTSILSTINKLRTAVPDIAIRTTFITGFPGETEEEFTELVEFIEEMKFERLGVFAYSREEDTAAYNMEKQVEDEIKEQRRDLILRRQMDISLENNQKYIGETLKVLLEELIEISTEKVKEESFEDNSNLVKEEKLINAETEYIYSGRTEFDAPEIDNAVLISSSKELQIGDLVEVRITDAYDYDLIGELDH
ncbi:MAG: 30S ribosomal protein S12 methylthiotransferase RimO, partial [Anaerovoracaceae bacterium]